jgi:hypothetical protein
VLYTSKEWAAAGRLETVLGISKGIATRLCFENIFHREPHVIMSRENVEYFLQSQRQHCTTNSLCSISNRFAVWEQRRHQWECKQLFFQGKHVSTGFPAAMFSRLLLVRALEQSLQSPRPLIVGLCISTSSFQVCVLQLGTVRVHSEIAGPDPYHDRLQL